MDNLRVINIYAHKIRQKVDKCGDFKELSTFFVNSGEYGSS